MKTVFLIAVYCAIGIVIAKYMGGDRSQLSPDVTYLDWIAFPLIVLFWPIILVLSGFAWLQG